MDRNQNNLYTAQDVKPESGSFFNTLTNKMETKVGKITATVAILFGTATLSACATGRDAAPEKPAAVSTADPSESASAEPTPSETASEAPSAFESELVGKPIEQTKTVEQMDAMDINQFANLPFADRFAYAYNTVGSEAYPTMDKTTEQEFLTNPDFEAETLNHFWGYDLNISYNEADPLVRSKLISGFRYYTTTKGTEDISESYQHNIDDVVANGGEGIGGDYLFNFIKRGEMQHGTDRDGNSIDFINYTYQEGNSGPVATTVDSPVTEEVKGGIKTDQAIRTEIKLLDGTDVIFYAQGYGIDGQQSPDARYPY